MTEQEMIEMRRYVWRMYFREKHGYKGLKRRPLLSEKRTAAQISQPEILQESAQRQDL